MKYVSGEVISISDAKGTPAEKVVVDFSPIQDFNGYDEDQTDDEKKDARTTDGGCDVIEGRHDDSEGLVEIE